MQPETLLPNGSKIPPGGPGGHLGLTATAARLNREMRHHTAADVLRAGLDAVPRVAMVSSFGAESVVLLHLVARVDADLPVLFIDTELLFAETLIYQQDVTEALGLSNVTILRSGHIARADPDNTLHRRDPDACCALRKSQPLNAALDGFDGWITGRKRFQSAERAALNHFEVDANARLKINPLAFWRPGDVQEYIAENNLPRHPLVARGFPSIGCMPCTTPVKPGEDPRAGRWRNTEKDECGIHFADGKMVRSGELT